MIPRSLFYPNAPRSTPVPIGINQTAPAPSAASGEEEARALAVEILANCAAKYVRPYGWTSTLQPNPQQVIDQSIENATRMIQEHAVHIRQQERWIPVTERLPKAGQRTFIFTEYEEIEFGKFQTDGAEPWWSTGEEDLYLSNVTHWLDRPLPEPPIAAAIRSGE